MSYLLPHLHSGWAVDQAILAEEERLVVIRFGHDWDETCMQVTFSISICSRLTSNLPSFVNKHIMIDLGTGNNNKINWAMKDKQEFIDIIETVFRGARKGRGLDFKSVAGPPTHEINHTSYIGASSNIGLQNDEDLKSVAGPPTHEINHTSYIGASSNIGAFKEGYLCNHEEFDRETTCYRLSTKPELAANWFHTKKSNGLEFIPFTNQATYTSSELVLFRENNSLLKECATQTHVWKP
ncbi:hypothetical protein F2Q70_00006458 [Brassica cretica]|uniref:Uncharacterized protein n=1 Tax=Brassica cretica TaxID=69181 RepID=A0A8S9J0X3_BRACR|nr:hypothetical protein F2Q70_00006458 [Brassica cretica]